MKEKRNMGLEWLRICAMFLIILLHSIDHSGLYESLAEKSGLYYYEQFVYYLVQVCVNCFVLISGYFLVKSEFKLKKLLSLWVEVVFYALVIKVVMMAAGTVPFSITSLISCLVPIFTGRYWFITIYFGLYLLFPFYNIAVRAMTKKQHKSLVIILVSLFSLMISIHPSFKGMNSGGAWGLAWFTVLYFIAAYLRCHYTPNGKIALPLIVFFACPSIMTIILTISRELGISPLTQAAANLRRYDSLPVLIASIALMLVFMNCRVSYSDKMNKLVTRVSQATFGVYLIHAHADICIPEMWQRIGMVENIVYWWFPLYQIAIVAAIFAVCVLLDWIRQALFNIVRINRLTEKASSGIEKCIAKLFPSLM